MRVFLILTVLLINACAKPPVNRDASAPLATVNFVDIDRYLGKWYEIARYPNNFEEGCEGVTAEYSRREDGLIRVVNTCRKGAPDGPANASEGRARIVDETSNAKLEVSFFGPFWGDYWIIGLDDDYSLALVGEPAGRYLWILSRTPTIDDAVRAGALERLSALGYDISALYFTEQAPLN
ncbi:MAG: lipocalin family protein [Pseudomonadota bacterium]